MKKPGCTADTPAQYREGGLLLVRVKQNLFKDVSLDSAANRFWQVVPGLGHFYGLIIHNRGGALTEHQPGRIYIQNLSDFVDLSGAKTFAILNLLNDGLIGAGTQCQLLLSPASFPSFSA
jgi:hypothetical protein